MLFRARCTCQLQKSSNRTGWRDHTRTHFGRRGATILSDPSCMDQTLLPLEVQMNNRNLESASLSCCISTREARSRYFSRRMYTKVKKMTSELVRSFVQHRSRAAPSSGLFGDDLLIVSDPVSLREPKALSDSTRFACGGRNARDEAPDRVVSSMLLCHAKVCKYFSAGRTPKALGLFSATYIVCKVTKRPC
jgi:hypothetical protein